MIDLVVDGLAAWRLTHLVVADAFPPVDRARQAVMRRFGPSSSVTYLVTCPYCMGVWVAGLAALARRLRPDAWRGLARVLAVAAVVPFIEAAAERVG